MVEPNELPNRLRAYIRSELMTGSEVAFSDDDPLFSGGILDSFALAEIGVWLEREFGIFIPDGELTVESMDSVNLMAERALRAGRR